MNLLVLPDELTNKDAQELEDVYMRLWQENRDGFASLELAQRWIRVFKRWLEEQQ